MFLCLVGWSFWRLTKQSSEMLQTVPPFIFDSGLHLHLDSSFIVAQAAVCFFAASCLDKPSICPSIYSTSAFAYASLSCYCAMLTFSGLLLFCFLTVGKPLQAFFTRAWVLVVFSTFSFCYLFCGLSANPYKHFSQERGYW